MKEVRTLKELFSLPGFSAQGKLKGIFGDSKARIVELKRQKKERYAQDVGNVIAVITTQRFDKYEISMRRDGGFLSVMNSAE